jgi:uncharacterized protein YjbJ (UPF0337 family)
MAMKDKARNIFQVNKGKIKEATGNAVGNKDLEADGRHDQKVGDLKQAAEKVKDAFRKR